jgi:tRNA G10  N-methylase Trm11
VKVGRERITPHDQSIGFLYERAMPSTRSGALFNAFSYPTKISPEVIALYIATHTRPGDTVLDVFAGSGTTGIATKLCDAPTAGMTAMAKSLGVQPEWGPRKAVLYEISVIGSLLAEQMTNPPDPERFTGAAADLIASATNELSWMYEAVDPEGKLGRLRHITWTEVIECVSCGQEITYWDAAVRTQPLKLETSFECPTCAAIVQIADCHRATTLVTDEVTGEKIHIRKRVPARVYGSTGKQNWQRSPVSSDLELLERVANFDITTWFPSAKIFWGDLYRSGYHQGINRFHHLYTKRNLAVLSLLWDKISGFPEELRQSLRLLVLSFNAAHSTLMTRVVLKKRQKDFILTGAQSGVLYVSSLPVEKNVFEGVGRKVRTFVDAFQLTRESRSEVTVCNASSTHLELPNESVAYVFTDPPFGAYIPYAELNQINEAWLRHTTDRTEEAIVSPAQGKGLQEYGTLLKNVFAEVARVLKPEGLATVAFHSSKADVWKAVGDSFETAGFEVVRTSILDKTQTSFKQTVSSVSSRGDALFLLTPTAHSIPVRAASQSNDSILRQVVQIALNTGLSDELQPDRLYSRYVATRVATRETVSMGAAEFYAAVGPYTSAAAKNPKAERASALMHQKRLGQYFTGPRLASLLANLAASSTVRAVVDPMVGTGDMLTAVINTGARLERIGGVEIDPKAFAACVEATRTWIRRPRAVKIHNASAFDASVIKRVGLQRWDLVITNPPYVRYQLAANAGHHEVITPSAREVRANLLECLRPFNDPTSFLGDLHRIAKSYSGLADLAVPSWILCAGLVREGGTLAMVVPDTWLSRDYAKPIRELLDRHFHVEFIVEDADASWFDAALVRTTLVVARRRTASRSVQHIDGHVRVRLANSASNVRSLVGNLYAQDSRPEKSFAQTARQCLDRHTSLILPGCQLEWVPSSGNTKACKEDPTSGDTGLAVVPDQLARRLGNNRPQVISLASIGWRVGQGLRTGANSFFYSELTKHSKTTSTIRPNVRLWQSPLSVPSDAIRRVVRSQADISEAAHVTEEQICGAVLCLHNYLLPQDRDWIPMMLGGKHDSRFNTVPSALAEYIAHTETVNIGTPAEPRFIPNLSAVTTNVRMFDPRRPGVAARFWYQLPPFANRHEPDLFVARVNYRHPKAFYNVERRLLVDANFSTFWASDDSALSALAMLALLRSTWVLAAMEASGTVMGGGALKLEATQLRRIPVPAGIRKFDTKLRKLGEALSRGSVSNSWQNRVDDIVWRALGIAEEFDIAERVSQALAAMLDSRSK